MKAIISTVFFLCTILSGIAQESFVKNQIIIAMNGNHSNTDVLEKINQDNPKLQLTLNKTLSKRAGIHLLEFNDQSFSVPQAVRVIAAG